MAYIERKCPNCGVSYAYDEVRCHGCGFELEHAPVSEETLLEGIPKSQWHTFIDKNASRYVELFSEKEGKKLFFHVNWAALFFSVYWLCYRKMYALAGIVYAASTALSLALCALLVAAFQPAMQEAQAILEPYSQYMIENGSFSAAITDGSVDFSAVMDAIQTYNDATQAIGGKMVFWLLLAGAVEMVLFGLLADCLYRAHILRRISYHEGGASGWSLAGGILLFALVNGIVVNPLQSHILEKLLI